MQGSQPMKTYNVTVTREGKWWMIDVPAIDGLTQARRLSKIKQRAAASSKAKGQLLSEDA